MTKMVLVGAKWMAYASNSESEIGLRKDEWSGGERGGKRGEENPVTEIYGAGRQA